MLIEYRISYQNAHTLKAEELARLFDSSGIRRPTDDLDRIQKMIDHASLIVTAWQIADEDQSENAVRSAERLVGIARALTDFSFACYLSDLAVDRDIQRQGIGRELVQKVHAAIGEESMLLLLAAPEAMDYYPRIGFDPVANGWIIKRVH